MKDSKAAVELKKMKLVSEALDSSDEDMVRRILLWYLDVRQVPLFRLPEQEDTPRFDTKAWIKDLASQDLSKIKLAGDEY